MAGKVKAIPDGYHSLTPTIVVRGAGRAIEFYKNAFGAEERSRFPWPDGKTIMHAELKIGNSIFFLGDEMPNMGARAPISLGGTTGSIHVNVEDVDAAFKQAVAAGAQVRVPLVDMFWGDRIARVVDQFGHEWSLATHKEDVTPEEIAKRGQVFFKQMAAGKH